MISIPTDLTRYFWSQITTLDGVDFELDFRYNKREECYYLQILLPDQTVVAQGIKLVSNYMLLQAYASSIAPIGELFCATFGNDDSPAELGELGPGQRVELMYITREEMVALGLEGSRL